MKMDRTKLLMVLSEALDRVEGELLGVTDHHAKRVAWISVEMGRLLQIPEDEISLLAVGALLHDSALNEFREGYGNGQARPLEAVCGHCVAGENNVRMIPGCEQECNFVLYHHECADGSGPFGKALDETPLGAQIIHIADVTDRDFSLGRIGSEQLSLVKDYVEKETGRLFGENVSRAFLEVLAHGGLNQLRDETIELLSLEIPVCYCETDLRILSELFARIIDYKSPFTKDHSLGLAEKAEIMARHYGWPDDVVREVYCAGALHDIGKLMVDRDVLEKPGKLDRGEYQHIQSHAYETYRLLSCLESMGKILEWASYHHEKLNGAGYPFGKTASELDQQSRLLACLDIYQALTEDRPYKAGMPHSKVMSILREMVDKDELDREVTERIDEVFRCEEGEQEVQHQALFQCSVCGHIYEGAMLPDGYVCPVCGQSVTAFLRLLS